MAIRTALTLKATRPPFFYWL